MFSNDYLPKKLEKKFAIKKLKFLFSRSIKTINQILSLLLLEKFQTIN